MNGMFAWGLMLSRSPCAATQVALLQALDHPNIVRLQEARPTRAQRALVPRPV